MVSNEVSISEGHKKKPGKYKPGIRIILDAVRSVNKSLEGKDSGGSGESGVKKVSKGAVTGYPQPHPRVTPSQTLEQNPG